MPVILKNKQLELHIDLPLENYHFSRFDWTGKISKVTYNNIEVTSIERTDTNKIKCIGQGFYNEFGIDSAIGFNETPVGHWFHKIGIGLLKKEEDVYDFSKAYKIKPCLFEVNKNTDQITITCISESINGFSYILTKTIELFKSHFKITYKLQNTGTKIIETNEYNHNFIGIHNEAINSDYMLSFPFKIKPTHFIESINNEKKVEIEPHAFKFKSAPKNPFFFSNISGNETVEATWNLINLKHNIGISETGSFKTNKINLWGWTHVISPELFYHVYVVPNKTIVWSRTYEFYTLT
ncbi:hypothetical protein [Yeosuana sp. AK3]